MDINDVLGYLEHHSSDEVIEGAAYATLKQCAVDYSDRLTLDQFEYRWQIAVALFMASLHNPALSEEALMGEFQSIKKTFLNLVASVWVKFKDQTVDARKVTHLQLSYFYRLFGHYIERMQETAHFRSSKNLGEVLAKEREVMTARCVFHSHGKQKIPAKNRTKIIRYVFSQIMLLLALIGIFHGAFTLLNPFNIHPLVSIGVGIVLLIGYGILRLLSFSTSS